MCDYKPAEFDPSKDNEKVFFTNYEKLGRFYLGFFDDLELIAPHCTGISDLPKLIRITIYAEKDTDYILGVESTFESATGVIITPHIKTFSEVLIPRCTKYTNTTQEYGEFQDFICHFNSEGQMVSLTIQTERNFIYIGALAEIPTNQHTKILAFVGGLEGMKQLRVRSLMMKVDHDAD